jgi:hypothetical protein
VGSDSDIFTLTMSQRVSVSVTVSPVAEISKLSRDECLSALEIAEALYKCYAQLSNAPITLPCKPLLPKKDLARDNSRKNFERSSP